MLPSAPEDYPSLAHCQAVAWPTRKTVEALRDALATERVRVARELSTAAGASEREGVKQISPHEAAAHQKHLHGSAAEGDAKNREDDLPPTLHGSAEILKALGLSKGLWRKIKRLNRNRNTKGPICDTGPRPYAERKALLVWGRECFKTAAALDDGTPEDLQDEMLERKLSRATKQIPAAIARGEIAETMRKDPKKVGLVAGDHDLLSLPHERTGRRGLTWMCSPRRRADRPSGAVGEGECKRGIILTRRTYKILPRPTISTAARSLFGFVQWERTRLKGRQYERMADRR